MPHTDVCFGFKQHCLFVQLNTVLKTTPEGVESLPSLTGAFHTIADVYRLACLAAFCFLSD